MSSNCANFFQKFLAKFRVSKHLSHVTTDRDDMSGQEPNETQELEQKDAPLTVTTVSTAVKRKRTRRPKLIWVLGEKMRADDPRRIAFSDDMYEEATDDTWIGSPPNWSSMRSFVQFTI